MKLNLKTLGFSQREEKVYKALLKVGTSTVGPIIKESKIPSSKIYEVLQNLIDKGFVSFMIKNGRKEFKASPPEQLVAMIEEQKEAIKTNLIPYLKSLQKEEEFQATVYEGFRGIKAMYEHMLSKTNKKEEILVMGAPLKAQAILEPFYVNWNTRRLQKEIILKIIYEKDAKEYGEKRKKLANTKVRFLNKQGLAPTWMDIFPSGIIIFDLSKETPRGVMILSEEIAKSYKNYFDLVWKQAKE